ncbi:MAG: hypothetical protein HS126_35300 [Anaerolineales bacterium]|nr:hypothetical protein [Anaerolineales bacterium]
MYNVTCRAHPQSAEPQALARRRISPKWHSVDNLSVMRIEFEDWILSQKISSTAQSLFEEAIACYKASAYRAALLMSYLGFQTIIKDRILIANSPKGIPEGQWNSIVKNVQNDEQWDGSIYDAVQMKPPKSIFNLSDDVRQQITYWKNRRNDCAHSKRNKISFAHVEAFWMFLNSNLGKFVVDDSKESLLNDIRIYFDRTQTPAGVDYSFIIEQIPGAIELNEFSDFLEETYKIIDDSDSKRPFYLRHDGISFFYDLFNVTSDVTKEKLVTLLKSKEKLGIHLLTHYPNLLPYFADDQIFIRNLWYRRIGYTSKSPMPLYCSLLRNKLIPKNEIIEAHKTLIERSTLVLPSEEYFELLKLTGFYDVFKNIAFEEGKIQFFNWANLNADFVVDYLAKFPIDKTVASAISNAFSSMHYPYDLRDRLDEFLSSNQDKRAELLREINNNQFKIPKYLNSLGGNDKGDEIPF